MRRSPLNVKKCGGSRRLPRGGRRFTLVEVAVSLLVVAVGFTTVLSIFPVGLQMTQEAIYQGGGLQNAYLVANAAFYQQDATYQVPLKYRLNRAKLPNKPLADNADETAVDAATYDSVFDYGGLYYSIHYAVGTPTVAGMTWTNGSLSNPASLSAKDGDKANFLADKNYTGGPRLLLIRVTCYKTLPVASPSTGAVYTSADDVNKLGEYEILKWLALPDA